MDLKNWTVRTRDIETGHIKIVPNGDEYPTVLAFNGYHYRVVGLWGVPGKLLWLELERFYGDTIVAATFCPDELMEMDLGMSDDEQLSAWLGGLPFLEERDRYREKLDECVTDRDRWRAQALRDAAELERIEGSVPLRDRLAEVEADRDELLRRLRRVTESVGLDGWDDRAYLAERDQKASAEG